MDGCLPPGVLTGVEELGDAGQVRPYRVYELAGVVRGDADGVGARSIRVSSSCRTPEVQDGSIEQRRGRPAGAVGGGGEGQAAR